MHGLFQSQELYTQKSLISKSNSKSFCAIDYSCFLENIHKDFEENTKTKSNDVILFTSPKKLDFTEKEYFEQTNGKLNGEEEIETPIDNQSENKKIHNGEKHKEKIENKKTEIISKIEEEGEKNMKKMEKFSAISSAGKITFSSLDQNLEFNCDLGIIQQTLEGFNQTLLSQVKTLQNNSHNRHQQNYELLENRYTLQINDLNQEIKNNIQKISESDKIIEEQRNLKWNLACFVDLCRRRKKEQSLVHSFFGKWKLKTKSNLFRQKKLDENIIQICHNRRKSRLFQKWKTLYFRKIVNSLNLKWNSKLQETTNNIISDYEIQLQEIRTELISYRDLISQLEQDKIDLASHMKAALMRGVNALNNETLQFFQGRNKM